MFTPSVYAAPTAQGVTVHFASLGEYPSDIDRIEVVEQGSGQMVWRAVSRGEIFQLDRFQLVPGLNTGTLKPSYGRVHTEIPAHGSFMLQRGIAYRASVCFKGWPYMCKDADFMFGRS